MFHYAFVTKRLRFFDVPLSPSAIFFVGSEHIDFLCEEGIARLDGARGAWQWLGRWPALVDDPSRRGNDGVRLGERYFFGTMEHTPTPGGGALYRVQDGELKKEGPIGIPNSFLPHPEGILISDSLEKKTYLYAMDLAERVLWRDFSEEEGTPDGGCVSDAGTFFLCLWGAGAVLELNARGEVLRRVAVPAKNPTKCALRRGQLLLTSALTEVSPGELKAFPLSGQTFLVTL